MKIPPSFFFVGHGYVQDMGSRMAQWALHSVPQLFDFFESCSSGRDSFCLWRQRFFGAEKHWLPVEQGPDQLVPNLKEQTGLILGSSSSCESHSSDSELSTFVPDPGNIPGNE